VQRADVGVGRRLVEAGVEQHALQAAVGGDAHLRDAGRVRGHGLAVGVGEAAGAHAVRVAGEPAHTVAVAGRVTRERPDGVAARAGEAADRLVAPVTHGLARQHADVGAGDAGGQEARDGSAGVGLAGMGPAESGHGPVVFRQAHPFQHHAHHSAWTTSKP
jgi:hypothetical protein